MKSDPSILLELGSAREPEIGPYWSPSKQHKFATSPFLFAKNYIDNKWEITESFARSQGSALHDGYAEYIRTKGNRTAAYGKIQSSIEKDYEHLPEIENPEAYRAAIISDVIKAFELTIDDVLESVGGMDNILYTEKQVIAKYNHMSGGVSALPMNGILDVGYKRGDKEVPADWKTTKNVPDSILDRPQFIVAACLYYPLHTLITGNTPHQFNFHVIKTSKTLPKIQYLKDYNKNFAGEIKPWKGKPETLEKMIEKDVVELLPRQSQVSVFEFVYEDYLDHMYAVDQMYKMSLLNLAGMGDYILPNYSDQYNAREEWEYFVEKVNDMSDKDSKLLNQRYSRLKQRLKRYL